MGYLFFVPFIDGSEILVYNYTTFTTVSFFVFPILVIKYIAVKVGGENDMFDYRFATLQDLEKIWNMDVASNENDVRWIQWKNQYIAYNESGKATTFVALLDNNPIGQITVLFSPDCSAVKNRPMLCNGINIANMNAFRIEKQYEGQGHISKLVKMAEQHAKIKGYTSLTIGCEAEETRNLAIYLHFGYTKFVTSFIEDGELVLFYSKEL